MISEKMADIPERILHGPEFSSPTFEIELKDTSLDEYITNAVERSSNDVFMIDALSREKLMFKEFLQKSRSLAAELQALHCKKGTIVGIMSENRLEYPIVIFGTMLTGAILTCFNPAYTGDELTSLFNIAKPSVIFCSSENYSKIKLVISPACRIIVLNPDETLDVSSPYLKFSNLVYSSKTYSPVKNKPDEVVFILYSSGTTGLPKGVMLTHSNQVFMTKVMREENLIESSGQINMSILPMFHTFGLSLIFGTIARGQTLVIMRKFDKRLFLSTIQEYKIRQLTLVPTLVTFLLKSPLVDEYDLSSVESVVCGAAPVKPETELALKNKFKLKYFQQGYGMTESTLINTIKNNRSSKAGTCGSIVPGTKIKVVHTQTGAVLGHDEVGEICIKGPHIMKGYYGNEKSTAETIDKDGWLSTGDIGYYDKDGDFFIVDRAKELIKYKGFQVAPAEIEALLLAHPSIADSAVIGVPDEAAGELPRAYVVKRDNTTITEDEIRQYIADQVSSQKQLRGGVEFVTEIPKNPSGKILRRILRDSWTVKNQCGSKI